MTAWFALYAPAGIPEEAQAALVDAAKQALATPEIKAQFASFGATAGAMTGQELSAFEKTERQRWSQLIKARNITTK